MKQKQTNLDQLKGKNPFRVPDGYMEGLTGRIMSQLPEKPHVTEAKQISLMDRMRPWLYLAAVFAGLGLFFKAIVGDADPSATGVDSLLVRNEMPAATYITAVPGDDEYDEDMEYLEYIEAQYANSILAEEMALSE